MSSTILKPTLKQLQVLIHILPDQWHKFGIEYRSIHKNSAGFVLGGQLQDGRRFTLDHLKNQFTFTR